MGTIGFLAAYLIETSGEDQHRMDFVAVLTNISCATFAKSQNNIQGKCHHIKEKGETLAYSHTLAHPMISV